MASETGEVVQLYVYDLSRGMASALSPALLGQQIDGIWHTSVVIGGEEHYFGGGINVAVPAGSTPYGKPVEIVDLGHTHLPRDVRESLLVDLSESFTPESYSLINFNCNTFADEYARLLTGRGVPDHITGLPAAVLATPFGQMLLPMMQDMETRMRLGAHHIPDEEFSGFNASLAEDVGPAVDSNVERQDGCIQPAHSAEAPAQGDVMDNKSTDCDNAG